MAQAPRTPQVPQSLESTVTLSNGVEMPWFGLGVFKSEPGQETESAVRSAQELGYRAIDTAMIYRNEADVGRALEPDTFLTTKVWNSDQGYDSTLRAFEKSMNLLGREQLDLYLIHWPKPELMRETWRAMERLYNERLCRAIGVSNFLVHHLESLAVHANEPPTVNQIELHPYLQEREVRDYCNSNGIVVEAWSPIAKGQVVDDPVLQEIAATHGKTPVQVTLRWELQHGIVVIPKSVRRERIAANADVFDFELSREEMARIDTLDQDGERRLGPHPDHVDF